MTDSMGHLVMRLGTRIVNLALVLSVVLGLGLLGQHGRSNAAQVQADIVDSGGVAVILNRYAAPDQREVSATASPLADGAIFIAAALPGPCSAEPPCFDRAAVLAELIDASGSQTDCYTMSNVELAGGYVTGRIDTAPRHAYLTPVFPEVGLPHSSKRYMATDSPPTEGEEGEERWDYWRSGSPSDPWQSRLP